MVQLVFIHGVNTRKSPAYESDVKKRQRFFAEQGLGAGNHDFYDPYWGHLGAEPAHGARYLDFGGAVLFAHPLDGPEGGAAQGQARDLFLQAARMDFAAALNSIAILLAQEDPAEADSGRIAEYIVAAEDAEGHLPAPDWLWQDDLQEDGGFLAALDAALPGPRGAGNLAHLAPPKLMAEATFSTPTSLKLLFPSHTNFK